MYQYARLKPALPLQDPLLRTKQDPNAGRPQTKLFSSIKHFISTAIAEYRQQAQQRILADPRFEDFAAYVRQIQADRQQLRMPVLQ